MEISSSLFPRPLVGAGAGIRRSRFRVRFPVACGGGVFSDEAHLKYYAEKEERKRKKLIKGLKKDLSELSSMAFGGDGGEMDQSNKINEMAAQLLEQLNQLKIEEKDMKNEMKMKKKEEKIARMNEKKCNNSSSSSSSSESSESDNCEESQILRFSDLKIPQNNSSPIVKQTPIKISSEIRKIEVCMGGKCKKNGSAELLNKIEEKMGVGNTVIGCKCMGKCKEGPNVRISNYGSLETDEFLCVGVGLDDVDSILEKKFEVGLERVI